MEATSICMLGNVLVDLIVKCDEALLKKFNLQTDHAIELEDWQMALFDDIQGNIIARSPGGCALNSSRVLTWVLGDGVTKNLVTFIGCIGNDEGGTYLEREVEKAGVNFLCLKDESEKTGLSADLVCGTTNCLCANIGASRKFQTSFLFSNCVQDCLQRANIFYIEGYFLTHSLDAALYIAKMASANGKIFCINVSAKYVCQQFGDNIKRILPYTDIIFGNEDEMKALFEITAIKNSSLLDNLKTLSSSIRIRKPFFSTPFINELHSNRVLVVTRGSQSVLVTSGENLAEFQVPRLNEGALADTVGAGDAFVGGFFGHMITGKDLAVCVGGGITAALAIIQQNGCTIPSKPFAHFQTLSA